MMRGRLYIDGIDAYARYGVFVTEGGVNDLIAYPPLKTPNKNDYYESDGIEVDLDSPQLDKAEVTVRFAVRGLDAKFHAFIALLSDHAYHEFDFRSLGRKFRLRLTSQSSNDLAPRLGLFSLKFSNDFPTLYRTLARSVPPPPDTQLDERFLIDDYSVTFFGVKVLEGVYSQLTKTPNVRKNLERTSATISGVEYDDELVVYEAKDIVLTLLFRADTLTWLWRRYDSLLWLLTRPGERRLSINLFDIEKEFPCFYKKCSVKEFFPEDKWLRVDLTLTLTRDFRIEGKRVLLGSEDDKFIVTEGANPHKIEIFPKCRLAYLLTEDGRFIISGDDKKIQIFKFN